MASQSLNIGYTYRFEQLGGKAKYLGPRYVPGSTDAHHRFRMLEDGKRGAQYDMVTITHSDLWGNPCATPSTSATNQQNI